MTPDYFVVLSAGCALLLAGLSGSVARHWHRRGLALQRATAHAAARAADLEISQDELFRTHELVERYRSLIEDQDDLVVRRKADGTVTFANKAYVLAVGATEAQDPSAYPRLLILESGDISTRPDGSLGYDQAIRTPSGVRWISWIESDVRGIDGGLERQCVGRDVTERRRVEQDAARASERAASASDAKSRFLATVSHEIRTPLAGVMGMAGLLSDTGLSPEQTTYVRAITTSGETLLSLIDEILDFSRIEAGHVDMEMAAFDIRAVIEDVVELLAPRAQGKGLEIAAFVASDVPERCKGDAARLRQILLNLAGNAIKFTDDGGVGLTVEATDAGIAFSIEDSGPGIPEDRIAAIFDEFERLDGSAASRHPGTGLGLAISRRLVAMMGGTITVVSRPGHGSTFAFAIPLQAVQTAVGTAIIPASGRSAVMVARDTVATRTFMRALQGEGFAVSIVQGAEDVETMLQTGSGTDIVFVDAAMGDGVIRRMSRADARVGRLRKVILMSPFERRELNDPVRLGYDNYLMKPVRGSSLRALLRGAMDAAPSAQAFPIQGARLVSPHLGMRVLLAEDNEINALIATKHLERLGAHVVWARAGDEALRLFEMSLKDGEAAFELGLLDVRMPGLDGHAVARAIRKHEAAQQSPESTRRARTPLRLVALTANAFPEDRDMALQAGFDAFMVKPMSQTALQTILDDLERRTAVA